MRLSFSAKEVRDKLAGRKDVLLVSDDGVYLVSFVPDKQLVYAAKRGPGTHVDGDDFAEPFQVPPLGNGVEVLTVELT